MNLRTKKILIASLALSLTIGTGIWVIDKYMSSNKKEENKTIAMFLENEEGTYTASTDGNFPTDGYVLNTEMSSCRNGSIITQNPNTKKISLAASQTDSCTLYFDKVVIPTSEQTLAKLGLTSNGVKDSFSTVATTDEGVFEMEDDYGTSYYFRGAVTNNYVKFGKYGKDVYFGNYSSSNASYKIYSSLEECNNSTSYKTNCRVGITKGTDMYWRIIRINGDGSLRIIYDGTSAHANGESNTDRVALINIIWNTTNYNDAKYVGYMYGGSNGEASTSKDQAQTNETSTNIKTQLETWYKENIVDTGFSSAISDEVFCNDRSTPGKTATGWSADTGLGYETNKTGYGAYARLGFSPSGPNYNNPKPSFKCPNKNDAFTKSDTGKGNGELEYPAGLITADEIVAAGGKLATTNKNYYLYKGTRYWSLSPSHYYSYAYVFMVHVDGNLDDTTVESTRALAPVINLSAEYVSTLIGDGSMQSPYRTAE